MNTRDLPVGPAKWIPARTDPPYHGSIEDVTSFSVEGFCMKGDA